MLLGRYKFYILFISVFYIVLSSEFNLCIYLFINVFIYLFIYMSEFMKTGSNLKQNFRACLPAIAGREAFPVL